MLSNGEDVVAEIPLEHIAMYEKYGRIGVILKLGGACECCGKSYKHFLIIKTGNTRRFALYTEDYIELTRDHIKPKHLGGKDKISNYQVLCLFCNQTKGSMVMSIEELREKVRSIVKNIVVSL